MVRQHYVGEQRLAELTLVVEMLKHDKVDVNLQDQNGWTAFCWASQSRPITDIIV
jgi:ankyrin repeat protein